MRLDATSKLATWVAKRLTWARLEANGRWSPLPTRVRWNGGYELEAETSHFSVYSFITDCRASGTDTTFDVMCSTFNDVTVSTSLPVTLDAEAGPVALIMQVKSVGSSVHFSLSGLDGGHTYSLYVDSFAHGTPMTANGAGKLSFDQDMTSDHVLILQKHPASVSLTSSTCATYGTFDAGTCTLAADIPDSVSLDEDAFTLDCASHTIGTPSTTASVGVLLVRRTDVTVRNCKILSAQNGYLASSCTRPAVDATSATNPDGGLNTTAFAILGGIDATLTGITADGFHEGIVAQTGSGLIAKNVVLHPAFLGMDLNGYASAALQDFTVDSSRVVLGTFPLAGLLVENGGQAQVTNFDGSALTGFDFGIQVAKSLPTLPDAVAVVSGATVSGTSEGINLVDPDAPSTVTDSTLTGNDIGLFLIGSHVAFHNNIFGNTTRNVFADRATELSDTNSASSTFRQGNYWGHGCPGPFFTAGSDSNDAAVVDSFPYALANGWLFGSPGSCAVVPVITSPDAGSALNNPRPEVNGIAPAGSNITVLVDGIAVGSSVAVFPGAFSVTPSSALQDGAHTLVAAASVDGGSLASTPISITIDTVPPSTPTITWPPSGITLATGTPAFSGAAEPKSTVRLLEGGQALGTGITRADGGFTAFPDQPLADGPHTIIAVARDVAGNSSGASQPVVVTIAAPSTTNPVVAPGGKLQLTALGNAPNPFTPGASSSVAVAQGQVMNTNFPNLMVAMQRTITDPSTGAVIATITTNQSLQRPQQTSNQPVSFALQAAWDGTTTAGGTALQGNYLDNTRIALARDVPQCKTPFSNLTSSCILDVTAPATFSVTIQQLEATVDFCDSVTTQPGHKMPAVCGPNCNGGIPPAATDILPIGFSPPNPDVPTPLPVISECEFNRLLSIGTYGGVSAQDRASLVAFSALANSPTALGVHGQLVERAVLPAGPVIVARDDALSLSGRVQATDFSVAAITISGPVAWMLTDVRLRIPSAATPTCSTTYRGCAPLPRSSGAPQKFSSPIDVGAGLPGGVVVNAEASTRPSNASGKTIEMDIFNSASVDAEANGFVCALPIQVTDCNLAAPAPRPKLAPSDVVALPAGAVVIPEDDFVRFANKAGGAPTSASALQAAVPLVAAANHPAVLGVTAQLGGTEFAAKLLVVARDPWISNGVVTATQFYVVPGTLRGNAAWVGVAGALAFSAPVHDIDFSGARCGPRMFPDAVPNCPNECPQPPASFDPSAGYLGLSSSNSGGNVTTLRTLDVENGLVASAVSVCTLFVGTVPSVSSASEGCGVGPTGKVVAETCNGIDDNCNGLIDEGGVCDAVATCTTGSSGTCAPIQCDSTMCGPTPDGCGGVIICPGVCP
jgi:hypothetical protein